MRPTQEHLFLSILTLTLLFSPDLFSGELPSQTVWVVFKEKAAASSTPQVSRRALARRWNAGVHSIAAEDLPVNNASIRRIVATGAILRHTFRWANAASFQVSDSIRRVIEGFDFVHTIVPLRTFTHSPPPAGMPKSIALPKQNSYGYASAFSNLMNIPTAHAHIQSSTQQMPGAGVLIALFDTGFRLSHHCLQHLSQRNAIVADSDFVDFDDDVYHEDMHGTQTLALIGGYDPGEFLGVAYGANFVLARTEEVAYERHIEEDNWVAALVWAESLGVDIVNSSLGYRYDFDTPDTNYTYESMDGYTTSISRIAAEFAISRGMVIVNSIGNEGDRITDQPTLNAPSDAQGVISVGAIDIWGAAASFSSRGPSYDGRIKPDVVAPGVALPVPSVAGPNLYLANSGTSFAAPIVAGMCGLIKQMKPGANAHLVRNLLFASCRFSPLQLSVDNTYGRGIPDAFLSITLDSNSYHVFVRDSLGHPVEGAVFRTTNRQVIDTSDTLGDAVISLTSMGGDSLEIGLPGMDYWETIKRDSLPWGTTVTLMPHRVFVWVLFPDEDSLLRVSNPTIYWQKLGQETWKEVNASGSAPVPFSYADTGTYLFFASAPGFVRSEDQMVHLSVKPDTFQVVLTPRPAPKFVLRPTVLSRNSGERLFYEFVAQEEILARRALPITVMIRTIEGRLLWKESGFVDIKGSVDGSWHLGSHRETAPSPGTYFFVLIYNDKTHIRKFIIRE